MAATRRSAVSPAAKAAPRRDEVVRPVPVPLAGPPDAAEEMAVLIGQTRRRLRVSLEQRLGAAGEEISVWLVLRDLLRRGPLHQTQLASGTYLDPALLSRLLTGMEARGLARRTRDAGDRRRVLVTAGPRAARRFAEVNPAVAQAVAELLAPLSKPESRQLRRLLEKLQPAQGRP